MDHFQPNVSRLRSALAFTWPARVGIFTTR